MKLLLLFTFFLTGSSFAAEEVKDKDLYDRKNNTMIENPRNPAMVKGFQEVGQKNKKEKQEEKKQSRPGI